MAVTNLGQFGGYTAGQIPSISPQQQQLQNQSIQQLLKMLGQNNFEPIAQQARTSFNQVTVPGLAERFSSLSPSGGGALSSPAFASQLGQAGAGLEGNLAALRGQYNLGQQGLLSGLAMQPSFQNILAPPQQQNQGWGNILGGLGAGLGYSAPGILGGVGTGIQALINLLLGRG